MRNFNLTLLVLLSAAATTHAAGPPADIMWKKVVLADAFYSEGAAFGDFNHDGQQDVTSGGYWYEGPDFKIKHQFADYPRTDPHGYSKDFLTFTYSFKHDGWDDILIVGFPGEATILYENPRGKSDGPWAHYPIFKETDNESPTFCDLLGNGKKVLICGSEGSNPQGGRLGYAQPDEADPTKPWVWHPVSSRSKRFFKYLHGLGVGDVNGDGRNDILCADGWYEQPNNLDKDPEWKFHPARFFEPGYGEGGSQMFVYDVNGDGRNDVICALQAHGFGLAWFEQEADGSFEKHLIMGKHKSDNAQGVEFSQLHAVDLVDVDGDGLKDIITGKRWWAHGPTGDVEAAAPPVLYWFKLMRKPDGSAEFVAHQIDDQSGVGTQVTAKDISNSKRPAILVGNKRGAFLFLQEAGAKQ